MSAPQPKKADCQALESDAGFECERCCLAWDRDDARPACQAVTFTRLRDALLDEAHRIEGSQRALVEAGVRGFRHQPALATALALRRVARLVDDAKARAGAKKGRG